MAQVPPWQMASGASSGRLASTRILAVGEPFFVTDNGRLLIGDGVHTPAQLNHLQGTRYDSGDTFFAKCDSQYGNAVIYVASDSTGVSPTNPSTGRWVKRFASRLAADYPNAGVALYDNWDDTNKVYGAGNNPLVIQAGAPAPSGTVVHDSFTRTAADLKGTNADTGQPWIGTSGTHGDFSTDGSHAVRTAQAVTGNYVIDSQAAGDRTVTEVVAAISTLPQSPTMVHRVYTKYLDSNGSNYVMLGLSITNAATIFSIYKSIGGTLTTLATSGTNPIPFNQASVGPFTITLQVSGTAVTGTVNGVTINGALAPSDVSTLAPATMDGFYNGPTNMQIDDFQVAVVPPNPVHQITIYNGAVTGSMLATQQAELTQQCPVTPDLVIANSCHNYNSNGVAAYWALLDQFFNTAISTWPSIGMAIMSQNPEKSPALGVSLHMIRNQSIRAYARLKGIDYIPVLEAFRALPDKGVSLVRSIDGVHPTDNTDVADAAAGTVAANGAQLWERAVHDWAKAKMLAVAHLN